MMKNWPFFFVVIAMAYFLFTVPAFSDQKATESKPAAPAVKAELNGFQIEIDATGGNILKLASPGPGAILETTSEKGRMLDLAFPLSDFEPFR